MSMSMSGHGKLAEPVFDRPIGWKRSPKDWCREPLVDGEDEMSKCLNERPLAVDRLAERSLRERMCAGDRFRPLVVERRPRGAHVIWVRGSEHGAQRVPRVTFVHIGRYIDTVDDDPVDQRVDVDVDKPGVADLRVGEVDVGEPCAAEVGTPEHSAYKISLELFRYDIESAGVQPQLSHRVTSSQTVTTLQGV